MLWNRIATCAVSQTKTGAARDVSVTAFLIVRARRASKPTVRRRGKYANFALTRTSGYRDAARAVPERERRTRVSCASPTIVGDPMDAVRTIGEVVAHAQAIVEPFAEGRYAADWEHRACVVSAISDYLIVRLRDDAFVADDATSPRDCYADVGFRSVVTREIDGVISGKPLAFPRVEPPSEADRQLLSDLCATLDYSEKIVISATAFAMRQVPMQLELFSAVANILFEEAYHLHIVNQLIGLEQSTRPWLADDKRGNWQLVRECRDGSAYMLLEHLLFEARGAIASAKGVHEAKVKGVSAPSVEWLDRICRQETNHGIGGLLGVHRYGNGSRLTESSRAVLKGFIENECDDQSASFRAIRQRYPLLLLQKYWNGTSIDELVAMLKADVRQCRVTGQISPTLDEVLRATEAVYSVVS